MRIVDDEIQVRGPNVMAGYLTEEAAFTADGYYRTGDIGRATGLGFEYLSRSGDALRLSGFLVHPREIEGCIATLDGVEAAAVVEHRGTPGRVRGRRPEHHAGPVNRPWRASRSRAA